MGRIPEGDVLQPVRDPREGFPGSEPKRGSNVTRSRKLKPVEPPADGFDHLELEQRFQARRIFEEHGWGPDAGWLSKVVFPFASGVDIGSNASDHATRLRFEALAQLRKSFLPKGGRDAAILAIFARLCEVGGRGSALPAATSDRGVEPTRCPLDASGRRRLAQELASGGDGQPGADFGRGLVSGGWPGDYQTEDFAAKVQLCMRARVNPSHKVLPEDEPQVFRLIRVLVEDAKLPIDAVISTGGFAAEAVRHWPRDFDPSCLDRLPPRPTRDESLLEPPTALGPWLFALGLPALGALLPGDAQRVADSWGAICLGLRCAIERWLERSEATMGSAGRPLAEAVLPWFRFIADQVKLSRDVLKRPAVRRSLLWVADCLLRSNRATWDGLPESDRSALLALAVEEAGHHRELLRRARPRRTLVEGHGALVPTGSNVPAEETVRVPWEEFEWAWDQLSLALSVLFRGGGIWRGLKPTLLLWRALGVSGLSRDLRYWFESGLEDPPEPWSRVFRFPMGCFEEVLPRELASDKELEKLRGELARYCLDRLVDKLSKEEREANVPRTNDSMKEPLPVWRYHLIRASSGLGVNPEGRGQSVLEKSASIDPDPEVQEAAHDAFQRLRRNLSAHVTVEPVRALVTALWWIRQAHVAEHNPEHGPDPDGAQRTYAKELKRFSSRVSATR